MQDIPVRNKTNPLSIYALTIWALSGIFFFVFRGGLDRGFMLDIVLTIPLSLAGIGILWVALAQEREPSQKQPPLNWWVAATIYGVTMALWAGMPPPAKASLTIGVGIMGLYWLGSQTLQKKDWDKILNWMTALALTTGLWGAWHYGDPSWTIWGEPRPYGPLRVGGMIHYPNTFATCSLLLALTRWARYMAESPTETKWNYLVESLAIGTLMGLTLLSGSRGATWTMALGAVVITTITIIDIARHKRKNHVIPREKALTIGIILACIFFWGGYTYYQGQQFVEHGGQQWGQNMLQNRLHPLKGDFDAGIMWRASLITDSAKTWAESPTRILWGGGVNSFQMLYEKTRGSQETITSTLSHSSFADWLFDYGILGSTLLLTGTWLFLRGLREKALWMLPTAMILVLRGCFDSDFHTPLGGLTLAVTAGWTWSHFSKKTELSPNPKENPYWLKPLTLTIGALLLGAGIYQTTTQIVSRDIIAKYRPDSLWKKPPATREKMQEDVEELLKWNSGEPANFEVAHLLALWSLERGTGPRGNDTKGIQAALELASGLYKRNRNHIQAGVLTAILLAEVGEQETGNLLLDELESRFPKHLNILWGRAQIATTDPESQEKATLEIRKYLTDARPSGRGLGIKRQHLGEEFLKQEGKRPLGYWP